jgi:hypothetical protein
VLFECFRSPIKKQHVTAKRRGAPQRCFSNQEERQFYRNPNDTHIRANDSRTKHFESYGEMMASQ